jgi:hypothetical protein
MKKFFKKITGKEFEDEQVHDDNHPQEKQSSFKSPADLALERCSSERSTPEEQGGPVVSGTYSPTRITYNRPEDGIFNRPMFVAKWITDHCHADYNAKDPLPMELQDDNVHRHLIAKQIINQSRLALTEPPTVIDPVIILLPNSRSLPSKSPQNSEEEKSTNTQEALSQRLEQARASESTHTTITAATLTQQTNKSPSHSDFDLPATHSDSSDSTITVTAAVETFDNAASKLKTAAPESSSEPKSIPPPAEPVSEVDDSLTFLSSMMQSAGLLPAGAVPPTDVSALAALVSSTNGRPIPTTNYTPSIDHLVVPRQQGQVQIRKSQLECHGRHGGWHGPRPNGVHCVHCQLCLNKADAIFQCRFCAMVVCGGCRSKVDQVMARPVSSGGGGVGGAGPRRGLALGGGK